MFAATLIAAALYAAPFDCAGLAIDLARSDARERRDSQADAPPPSIDELAEPYAYAEIDLDEHMLAKYAEYLATTEEAQSCDCPHPYVQLVSALWRWNTTSTESFAKTCLAIDGAAARIYRIRPFLYHGDTSRAPVFTEPFGDDIAYETFDRVLAALRVDTPNTAELLARLVEESDGHYGEWTAGEILRLFAARPELVAPHLERWNTISGNISSGLAFFGDDDHVDRIRAHWDEAPDSPAKTTVLNWLAAAEDAKNASKDANN